MSSRALMIAALCGAMLILTAPLIVRGVENFRTFLSLQLLLNKCDGAGSPGC